MIQKKVVMSKHYTITVPTQAFKSGHVIQEGIETGFARPFMLIIRYASLLCQQG